MVPPALMWRHGHGDANMVRGPNETGGFQLDGRVTTLQDYQALGSRKHARSSRTTNGSGRMNPSTSAVHDPRVRRCRTPAAPAKPLAGSRSATRQMEQQGKAVFERAAHSATRPSSEAQYRSSGSTTCKHVPGPLDTPDRVVTPVVGICAGSAAAGAKCRTYEITLAKGTKIRGQL